MFNIVENEHKAFVDDALLAMNNFYDGELDADDISDEIKKLKAVIKVLEKRLAALTAAQKWMSMLC